MLRHDPHAHVERFAILHKLHLFLHGTMVIGVVGMQRESILRHSWRKDRRRFHPILMWRRIGRIGSARPATEVEVSDNEYRSCDDVSMAFGPKSRVSAKYTKIIAQEDIMPSRPRWYVYSQIADGYWPPCLCYIRNSKDAAHINHLYHRYNNTTIAVSSW
jgi:hypothetical protein